MMTKLGVKVSKEDIEERLLEFDIDKDGTINFDEVRIPSINQNKSKGKKQ